MENLVLKTGIVEQIKNDPILFGKVAAALYIKPVSLPYLLNNNNVKLTREPVLRILKKHLGVEQDNDLLQPMQEEPTESLKQSA